MRGGAGFPVRLRFTKRGKVRFISHRDVARAFERAFRIETVPLAFTGGFSPRPKVSFGLALPVGYESVAEYLDVELASEVDVDDLAVRVSGALPEGMEVTGASALADRAPALQEAVTSVAYEVDLVAADGSAPDVERVRAFAADALARHQITVTRTRKGRPVSEDVRPSLRTMAVQRTADGGAGLELEVITHGTPSARPGELLTALGGELLNRRVLRTHQWIERGGARCEPLDVHTRPRTLEVRAS